VILPVALTVAGSDSGGGAGMQADLKTFYVCRVHGTSAITSVTFQNTTGVQGRLDLPAEVVRRQLEAILEDFPVRAAKTGMLANVSIIRAVAKMVRDYQLRKLVVDPVMVSGTGHALIDEEAVETLKREILPLALVVTPNLLEAERLTGLAIGRPSDIQEAARELLKMGPAAVVIKGGHWPGMRKEAIDLFCTPETKKELAAPMITTGNTHGTGCVFSAAIAAFLARDWELERAVRAAKLVVTGAIRNSLAIGSGQGPVHPVPVDENIDDL
jgi:hydroxymethylpyrimidine/phosphomethylpyrimidine kinase